MRAQSCAINDAIDNLPNVDEHARNVERRSDVVDRSRHDATLHGVGFMIDKAACTQVFSSMRVQDNNSSSLAHKPRHSHGHQQTYVIERELASHRPARQEIQQRNDSVSESSTGEAESGTRSDSTRRRPTAARSSTRSRAAHAHALSTSQPASAHRMTIAQPTAQPNGRVSFTNKTQSAMENSRARYRNVVRARRASTATNTLASTLTTSTMAPNVRSSAKR